MPVAAFDEVRIAIVSKAIQPWDDNLRLLALHCLHRGGVCG